MELEEAIAIADRIEVYSTYEGEALETVLQELDRLQKENEDKKTYEFGLIVGTKRERDYWQNKIREKIEEINKKEKLELKITKKEEERDLIKELCRMERNILQDLLKKE